VTVRGIGHPAASQDFVTLNLFQGPPGTLALSIERKMSDRCDRIKAPRTVFAARWMLKQVQHDEVLNGVILTIEGHS
jgi:hypothetical protein